MRIGLDCAASRISFKNTRVARSSWGVVPIWTLESPSQFRGLANAVGSGMQRRTLDQILSCTSLPSLPTVAAEILDLTSDPNVPLKKIAEAVSQDQALAGKVLKTVNSSFYGLSKPCGSIERAMGFLGLNTVKSLVLGFSLVDITRAAEGSGFDLMGHWRRAIVGAVSSRMASKLTGVCDPDEAFTAGLFQDIGVLALFVELKQDYADVVAGLHHADWCAAERETFGFTHAEVGAGLAKKWNLPEPVRLAVGAHHTPKSAGAGHLELVRMVGLGSMVGSVLSNEQPIPTMKQIQDYSHAWFGHRAPDAQELVDRAAEDAQVIAKLFSQDIGDLPDTITLMAEAQEKGLEHQLSIQREAESLARDATTDALTGLANRRRFDGELADAFRAFQERGEPMAVVFCDADRFKSINDRYGHAAGDMILVELAQRMQESVGDRGIVARYGGEEFAVILPGQGIDAAAVLGEELRAAVDASPFNLSGVDEGPDALAVTVSVGVAATDADDPARYNSAGKLVGDADACVYEAKRSGRNRVFVHRPDAEAGGLAAETQACRSECTVRVLFVEDDPLAATLITSLLKRQEGVEIQWVESGTRARTEIERMDAGEIVAADVFLVDLNLPGTSGYDLLRIVRGSQTLSSRTFIVLSGEDAAEAKGECERLGANGFIPKQEFVADIGKWVGMIVGGSKSQAA